MCGEPKGLQGGTLSQNGPRIQSFSELRSTRFLLTFGAFDEPYPPRKEIGGKHVVGGRRGRESVGV